MTDIKLLPIKIPSQHKFTRREVRSMMTDYARANVEHATAPLHAEIERLRAEVALANDGWHQANGTAELAMTHRDAAEQQRDDLEAKVRGLRSERGLLAEALREAREFVDRHSESWYRPGQELLAQIDKALGLDKQG